MPHQVGVIGARDVQQRAVQLALRRDDAIADTRDRFEAEPPVESTSRPCSGVASVLSTNHAPRRSVRHRTDSWLPYNYSRSIDSCSRRTMKIRTILTAALVALTLVTAAGCAVSRGQQTAGAYIDDSAVTASVKTRMLEDERVAGTSITVETLNGTVMLSGFAKSQAEKAAAESIARKVDGVKAVKNQITVRPAA